MGCVFDHGRAIASHHELLARASIDFVDPTWLAMSALGIGAVDEAMEHASRAVEERALNQIRLVRRPGTEALHAHPRYRELRQRMGF